MIIKFSRIVLILTVIFVLSIVVPKYYWMMFEKNHSTPLIVYSSLLKDFIYSKRDRGTIIRYDNKGKVISKKQFEALAPLYFYRSLFYFGKMPAQIDTYKVTSKSLKLNTIFTQIKPEQISTPQIMLFPLIESKPDGPKLQMPNDFFRITDKMEFLDCETNTIIPDLTNRFTKALKNVGFIFPAKKIFGNPSVMKPYDDGYFVVDSKNQLFHIKRVHNNPYVKKITLPKGVIPIYIAVTEMELREFHALLISADSELYIISFKNYKPIKMPIKNYDYHSMKIRFQGNPLYRVITVISDTSLSLFVTDRKYNFVDEYKETWTSKYETTAGKVLSAVFPFSLQITSAHSNLIDFYFKFNGTISLVGMIISLLIYIFIQRRKGEEATQCKMDYLIVFLTGFYGLIATLLIRDETWKI